MMVAGLVWTLGVMPGMGTAEAFELRLKVRSTATTGPVSAELVAGTTAEASAGFDPFLDALAFRVGPLQAHFVDAAADPRARYLRRDFRPGFLSEQWILEVISPTATATGQVLPGEPVELSWSAPPETGTCVDRALDLYLDGAHVADMAQQSSHSFPAAAAGTPVQLELVVGAPGSASYGAPAVPEGLVIPQRGRRGVLILWAPVAGVHGYLMERQISAGPGIPVPWVPVGGGSTIVDTRYVDTQIIGAETVSYRVRAVSPAGCVSIPSAVVQTQP